MPLRKRKISRNRKPLNTVDAKDQSSFYFAAENSDIDFITTGCSLLDCVLGGGYAVGRIVNIVGDKSSGKTLLAIEACANFHIKYPESAIHYLEIESAFDKRYASSLGMPVKAVTFDEGMETVEDLFHYLMKIIADKKDTKTIEPTMVILDSLDALSDAAEMDREIDKGTFGATKAKQLSEMFRRLNKQLSSSNILFIVISQIRDKMNVMFGKKTQRTGGRALDFYASQVLWLAEIGKIQKVIRKVKRPIGVNVRAKCEKNKVGLPFRECEFPIIFGYGVDDLDASANWLKSIGRLGLIDFTEKDFKKQLLDAQGSSDVEYFRDKFKDAINESWKDIEIGFSPGRSKY